jgi:hypothetical protein
MQDCLERSRENGNDKPYNYKMDIKTMSEEAKAIQEVAKTTGKLAEMIEKIGVFISKVVGGASNQVGGILEDWAKYYRYKNLLIISDKVEALHKKRRLAGKTVTIPARIAIPMLESASLEDNETLQNIWARLIANSMDPNFTQPLHPGYIEIIKQMSPDEAVILNAFRQIESYPILFKDHVSLQSKRFLGFFGGFEQQPTYDGLYKEYLEFCKALSLKQTNNIRSFLDNLQRLRIIEFGYDLSQQLDDNHSFFPILGESDMSDKIRLTLDRYEYLRITVFGEVFITACIKEDDTNLTVE